HGTDQCTALHAVAEIGDGGGGQYTQRNAQQCPQPQQGGETVAEGDAQGQQAGAGYADDDRCSAAEGIRQRAQYQQRNPQREDGEGEGVTGSQGAYLR